MANTVQNPPPLPFIPTALLSRQHPTTSLTLPYIQPYFFTQTQDELEFHSIPSTPGRNGSRGVRIIDHSIITQPQQQRDLSRSTSENSINSTIILTPENQSPVVHTILLKDHRPHEDAIVQHFHSPTSTSIHQGDERYLQFTGKSNHHRLEEEVESGARSLEVVLNWSPVNVKLQQVQNQLQTQLDQSHTNASSRSRVRLPTTSFGRGEIIHPTFQESTSSTTTSDDDDDHSSVSSGYSSIIPQDQVVGKICMFDYWRIVDGRLQEEREERQKIRRFSGNSINRSEGVVRVKNWVNDQTITEPLTIQAKQPSNTRNELYTTLSPDPWLAKPHLQNSIATASRSRSKSFNQQASTQLMSALMADEIIEPADLDFSPSSFVVH